MKKIETLKIINNIILIAGILGLFILWNELHTDRIFESRYIDLITLGGLISIIFTWLFISTFCDNANNSKKILSLLKGDNIQKTEKQKQRKNKNTVDKDEIIDIEGMKQTVSSNELIVKVKRSGKIEKITKEDWEEIVKIGNEDKFEIKYKKD